MYEFICLMAVAITAFFCGKIHQECTQKKNELDNLIETRNEELDAIKEATDVLDPGTSVDRLYDKYTRK